MATAVSKLEIRLETNQRRLERFSDLKLPRKATRYLIYGYIIN